MYVKTEQIKIATENLLKNHGFIKRIYGKDTKPVGFLIRKEIENTDESASVLFNISFNYQLYNAYRNLYKKKFNLDEYKFFAIKHTENSTDDSKMEGHVVLNTNDEDIDNIMEEKLEDYLTHYFNVIYLIYGNDCFKDIYSNKNIKYIKDLILNVKNYYKNKKINVYFTINI